MTLTEFLLARIAETQAAAEGFHSRDCYLFVPDHMQADPPECDCGVPACVLADCEAKRRIVERAGVECVCTDHGPDRAEGCAQCVACQAVTTADGYVLADLALSYADHPDYREEWKP